MAPPRRRRKSTTPSKSTSYGMSPMESQARYGSIAGGGLQPQQVSRSVDVMNQLRQAQGQEPSYTARDFLTDKTQREMQYGRQADTQKFSADLDRAGQALDAGAKIQVGPDGIPRIQYGNIGMKDDQGRTILSTMLPSMSAVAPTFGQLGGDIKRGIMGGTAFSRAAGLPNPEDAQGIMALASKGSPLLNFLGVDFSPATGPSSRSMAQDYVGGQGMFTPDRSMTPTTPSREELLSRVGIESIPDATDSPAFKDLTPQEILETPLESFADIEKAFKQGALIDDLLREDYMSPTGGQGSRDYLEMTTTPFYKKYQELYEQYPDLYKSVFPQGRVILNPA